MASAFAGVPPAATLLIRADGGRSSLPCSLRSNLHASRLPSRFQAKRERLQLHRSSLPITAAVSAQGPDLLSSITGFFKRLMPQAPSEGLGDEPGEEEPPAKGARKVAVLGATGKTGKFVVAKLLEAGHTVTALVTSEDRANQVLADEMGLSVSGAGAKSVRLVQGKVQDPDALKSVLEGSDAVVCCLGSRRGPEGYEPGMSPEDVDWKGVCAVVKAARAEFRSQGDAAQAVQGEVQTLLDFTSCKEGEALDSEAAAGSTSGRLFDEGERLPEWLRRDDVIMGGQSESIFKAGNGFAVFEGIVRVEGGGFCGTGTRLAAPVDASSFDGFRIRVRGDGKRYKMNARDALQEPGELQYQASFDTVNGEWVDVFVPFSSFQSVAKAYFVPGIRPLDVSQLIGVQFVESRFQYNGFPNPMFEAGDFRLEVASISLERRPRTQFVLLSSAAVERSSRAETPEEREASIPIVKLNPVGVLSWKLSGEDALRASGLRYTVVRPCGLTETDQDESFLLESAQGDVLTGLISRQETAAVLVESLSSPYAANVTFEVRRDDLTKGLAMTPRHWSSLFTRLRTDTVSPIVQYPAVPQPMMQANKE